MANKHLKENYQPLNKQRDWFPNQAGGLKTPGTDYRPGNGNSPALLVGVLVEPPGGQLSTQSFDVKTTCTR